MSSHENTQAYQELLKNSIGWTCFKPIASALSIHGANEETFAIQKLVEEHFGNLHFRLQDGLVDSLREIYTLEMLKTSSVWKQIQAYIKLKKHSTSEGRFKEEILLALSTNGANPETLAILKLVEEVIHRLPPRVAKNLIRQIPNFETISDLRENSSWQNAIASLH